MKIESLLLPNVTCPVCEKKFIRTSSVAIISKKVITHIGKSCSMQYLMDENDKLPEENRERMSLWDISFRFTTDYEKSNKAITEEQLKDYQSMFANIAMLTDPIIVKRIVRDRIWKVVGKKYLKELQYLHVLNHIYEKNKDKWRSDGFKSTFIPSVLGQFKSKGYLSKKQWELVEWLVSEDSTPEDREYLATAVERASDMETVELPDRLRYMQRKCNFMEWYNTKNGIPEEE